MGDNERASTANNKDVLITILVRDPSIKSLLYEREKSIVELGAYDSETVQTYSG
jgi:hypothetical protein